MPSLDRLLSAATGALVLGGFVLMAIGATIGDSWKGSQLTGIGMQCFFLSILTIIGGIISERRIKKHDALQKPDTAPQIGAPD